MDEEGLPDEEVTNTHFTPRTVIITITIMILITTTAIVTIFITITITVIIIMIFITRTVMITEMVKSVMIAINRYIGRSLVMLQ